MDRTQEILNAVEAACGGRRRLLAVGAGTKRDWLPTPDNGELLSIADHAGIEEYQPDELVITVRAGTPLREVLQTLERHEQMFAFEPPLYYGGGTIGGAIAAGHSGPARPWTGAARDAVLGVKMINGKGQLLEFGGQVMKNVAGYDVSRLQVGAYGSLGVLLSISIRVQPKWETQTTLQLPLAAEAGLELVRSFARQPVPLTGTCWVNDVLHVRLGGNVAAVHRASQRIGGEIVADLSIWDRVRDHSHEFFKLTNVVNDRAGCKLWRMSTPPAAPLGLFDDCLVEWGGGLRWVWHSDDEAVIRHARDVGGWAWCVGRALPIHPDQQRYMAAIKSAFDPDGVFVSPLPLGA